MSYPTSLHIESISFRPITSWPGRLRHQRERIDSPFRASWEATVALLRGELRALHAKNAVLQIAIQESDLRIDGNLRVSAVFAHAGVILSFETKRGSLSFPCDRFSAWQDNVRAIALTLERLRAVDRYGVSAGSEQYRGWKALPAAPDNGCWWNVLGVSAEATRNQIEDSYRELSRQYHPDRSGNRDSWDLLQTAIEQARRARPRGPEHGKGAS